MTEQEKLEEAKRLYTTANADQKYMLESLFPELKESEDERIRKALITFFQRFPYDSIENSGTNAKEAVTWLEKQGDKPFDYENANIQQKDFAPKSQRMMSAKAKEALYGKPTWSEEDEKRYLSIMFVLLSTIGPDKAGFTVTREIDWLKSLKDRVQPQPKQEWSEEDECYLGDAIYAAEETYSEHCGREELVAWLKSIKERYTWKPSDEQMRALHDMNLIGNISYAGQGQTLIELYNDLKKLKGE